MRKKLAGIHLLAPLSESDITDLSRNLDRELIINTTPVTDAVIDTYEKTNYIVTFEYDTTLDGGTNRIRRSIPTLELLGNTDANISGTHWINLEDKDYHYIDNGATAQLAFEQLDEQLTKVCYLKHIRDTEGIGSIVSSDDGTVLSSVVDNSIYTVVLGVDHELNASNHGVILGGSSARMLSSLRSTIINGNANYIHDSNSVSIYGGESNIIGADASHAFIMHGIHNSIDNATESAILGGHHNRISEIENNAYGSFVIGSVYGYIGSSDFATLLNVANSYIINGRYTNSISSAYIELTDTTFTSIQNSANVSISKSLYSMVTGSTNTAQALNIYGSTLTSIINSTDSYLWYADHSSIINAENSSIGVESTTQETVSTGKALSYLTVADVSHFTIGQNVTLYGAEFNTYSTEYRIYNIDIPNKYMYFVKSNNTTVTFNTGSSTPIKIKALNLQSQNFTILSNTSDTLLLSNYAQIVTDQYVIIDGDTNKYAMINASGSQASANTIKLVTYGTSNVVTFTTNILVNKVIRVYNKALGTYRATIISGRNNKILNGANTIISAGYDNYIHSSAEVSIQASYEIENIESNVISIQSSYSTKISDSAVISILSTNNATVNKSVKSSIIGGYGNYITDGYDSGIIHSDNNHITKGSRTLIIGGYNNTIGDYSNVVLISCATITAWRSNVLMAPSIALTDRTFELKDKTPKKDQTLVVTSVNNNVATLDWGYAGGVDISSYSVSLQGLTEMLTGIRYGEDGTHYIDLYRIDQGRSDFIVGLTLDDTTHQYYQIYNSGHKSSYQYVDGIILGQGGVIDYSGMHIDPGYTYSITYKVNYVGWVDTYTSTGDAIPSITLSIEEKTTVVGHANGNVTLKNSDGVEINLNGNDTNRVTTTKLTYTSTDNRDLTSPTQSYKELRLSQIYNKTTRELTFAIANLYYNVDYSAPKAVTYTTDNNNKVIIDWTDVPGSTPTIGTYIMFFDFGTSSGGGLPTVGGEPTTVISTSVVDGRRYVYVAATRDPNESSKIGHVRYDEFHFPKLMIDMTCNVTKMSNSLVDALKAIIQ